MNSETKGKLQRRMKRAEGQLAAVRRMVDDDAYCVDVLIQIAAVQGALRKVGQLVLESHVRHCVTHAFESGDTESREQKIDELIDVFARYNGVGGE